MVVVFFALQWLNDYLSVKELFIRNEVHVFRELLSFYVHSRTSVARTLMANTYGIEHVRGFYECLSICVYASL